MFYETAAQSVRRHTLLLELPRDDAPTSADIFISDDDDAARNATLTVSHRLYVCVCVWTDFDGVFRRIATVERKRSSDNPDNVTD